MPPRIRAKKNGRKMPLPLPIGEKMTDSVKKGWVLGTSIGLGGFGEIYLAAPDGKDPSTEDAHHVIKIEPHENGPLFSELSYYRRVAKKNIISDWMKKKGLNHIGIPVYIASGLHSSRGVNYRFLVMQRYGDDLDKHFRAAEGKFCLDTVSYLAVKLALEFLHDFEYVHADIKGSNLLTGLGPKEAHLIHLVDYGLSYRFNPDGKHKEYKENPKCAHDGTIEFTSIDAHKGVKPSRRGDLEILGYNLLQWACGRLPWESNLNDKAWVATEKIKYQQDVSSLMSACFGQEKAPSVLVAYMTRVYGYNYKERPDYDGLIKLFNDHLGNRDAVKTLEWIQHPSASSAPPSRKRPAKESISPPVKRLCQDAKPVSAPAKLSSRKDTKSRKVTSPKAAAPVKRPRKDATSGKQSRKDAKSKKTLCPKTVSSAKRSKKEVTKPRSPQVKRATSSRAIKAAKSNEKAAESSSASSTDEDTVVIPDFLCPPVPLVEEGPLKKPKMRSRANAPNYVSMENTFVDNDTDADWGKSRAKRKRN